MASIRPYSRRATIGAIAGVVSLMLCWVPIAGFALSLCALSISGAGMFDVRHSGWRGGWLAWVGIVSAALAAYYSVVVMTDVIG